MSKFKLNQLVWFTKTMRMCKVIEIYKDGYTVVRLDTGKRLFATENGLESVDGDSKVEEDVKKDLNYYMSLNYDVEIIEISKKSGGGWMARIPLLGKHCCLGDGKTKEEALKNLEDIKKDLFSTYLRVGINIPEPD